MMDDRRLAEEESARLNQEAGRIADVYARRDASGKRSLYSWVHPEVHLQSYCLALAASRLLRRAEWTDLSNKECLDVGCGAGAWSRRLMEWGANPARLHGVDLLPDRIAQAVAMAPQIDYRVGTGWRLPYRDDSMDLVSAHTVFSSILDPGARVVLAEEIVRVTRPGGLIFVFDFRIRPPKNPDTTGIDRREVGRLFPKHSISQRTLVLAPPLQRTIARFSAFLAYGLEVLFPPLRTHVCYLMRRNDGVG